ncbi:SgcJ/EcaC family oxidoreductase [Streptomyces triticagri]|nr:SgcJ/EcaC family oxidoreductase [Streptomyces triticagri]
MTGSTDSTVAMPDPEALHRSLLASWNARDAAGFAGHFTEDGTSIGFDGSTVLGREAIEEHLTGIFDDHDPAAYVALVREIRPLGADSALLRADAGMVPPGGTDIEPAANAVQSLVAVRDGAADRWRIALFQNTPAAFHGDPEAADDLTRELREALRAEQL